MAFLKAWDGRSLYLLHWSVSRAERAAWMLLELGEVYPTGSSLPAFEVLQCPDGPEFRKVKPDWLRALNPNAKAPLLVDFGGSSDQPTGGGLPEECRRVTSSPTGKEPIVMIESVAIATYLCQRYDAHNKLGISGSLADRLVVP